MDEGDRGQGRDFTGFGDHRATRTKGGRHLPGHLQQRIVPRRDQHAHADGFAHHAADDGGVADVDEPVRLDGDEPGVVPENRCDVVDVDAALDQRLAGVPGFQLREGLLVPLEQIGDAAEQRGTFGHRCGGPSAVVERLPRGGDGIARVLGCGLVDDRGDASVGGVDDLASPTVGRMPPHTADQEIGFTIHIAHLVAEMGHYPLAALGDVLFDRSISQPGHAKRACLESAVSRTGLSGFASVTGAATPPSPPSMESSTGNTASSAGPVMRRKALRRAVRVEDGHLEGVGSEAAGIRAVAARLERVHGDLHRLGELGVLGVGLVELLDDRLGRTAHHHEVRFVGDRPVIGDAVELGSLRLAVVGHLGHAQFDLVGLGLFGEDPAEGLARTDVGQLAPADVAAVVGVAAGVGVLDAAPAQVVELVEPADGGEADPVVDLADLLQRPRRVLGNEQHAVGVGERDDAASPGNTLARELRSLAHRLFGRDEIRKAHDPSPRASALG